MVAILDPGFAWMLMATLDGGMRRIHPGISVGGGEAGVDTFLIFPRFGGAIVGFCSDKSEL